MAKPLIIVESPTKAKTIKKFLPARFVVKASVGHVRDLPKSTLGVDVLNGFTPRYLTIKGKGDIIKDLKAAAKVASEVYLATDPDREGEAIAWHLAELLKLENPKRIELHEITKDAALAALKDAHAIDMPRVNAQQARRILDRLVGYKISPLLWAKVRGGLSAGRVQSVAVRLIVDREREIRAFVPQRVLDDHRAAGAAGGGRGRAAADGVSGRPAADRRRESRDHQRRAGRRDHGRAAGRGVPRRLGQDARDAPQRGRAVHHLDAPARGVPQAEVPRPQDDADRAGTVRRRRPRPQRGHAGPHHLHAHRLDAHLGLGARRGAGVHHRPLRRGVPRRRPPVQAQGRRAGRARSDPPDVRAAHAGVAVEDPQARRAAAVPARSGSVSWRRRWRRRCSIRRPSTSPRRSVSRSARPAACSSSPASRPCTKRARTILRPLGRLPRSSKAAQRPRVRSRARSCRSSARTKTSIRSRSIPSSTSPSRRRASPKPAWCARSKRTASAGRRPTARSSRRSRRAATPSSSNAASTRPRSASK